MVDHAAVGAHQGERLSGTADVEADNEQAIVGSWGRQSAGTGVHSFTMGEPPCCCQT
jgi:hypothetical protein